MSIATKKSDTDKEAAARVSETQVTPSQFRSAPHVSIQEFVPLVRQTDPTPNPLPRKKLSESFSISRLFFKARSAIVNHVSPATSGTEAFDADRQKYEFEETMYEDAGPWHLYQKLDSDSDTINFHDQSTATGLVHSEKTSRPTKKEKFKSWIGRKHSKNLSLPKNAPAGSEQSYMEQ
jgi:hypothetical protein